MTATPELQQPSVEARTMRAIVAHRYGPPSELTVETIAVPAPAEDQVQVQVHASSLNYADWHLTTGTPPFLRLVAGFRRPRQPVRGGDVAGTVSAVGPGVTALKVGDPVYGSSMWAGGCAEYAVLPAGTLAPAPPSLDLVSAAAVPLAAVTALQALAEVGRLQPGQHVVVNGASGGVGTFAVQIAKALGARVTAVCSTRNVEQARSLGADVVVDYNLDDFTTAVTDADLVFDNVGNRTWRELRRVLVPGGRVVAVSGPKEGLLGPIPRFVGRKLQSLVTDGSFVWFTAAITTERLRRLTDMIETGAVRPVIERTIGLAEVPAALAEFGAGHSRGKIAIRIR